MNSLENIDLKMDSLEIARITGKNHFDVLRDVRKVMVELEIGESTFAFTYKTSQNKVAKKYDLPKNLVITLVSGYSIKLRKAIIDRWQELESIEVPRTFEEIMQNALQLADKRVKELEDKIKNDKPLVSFAKTVGNTNSSILIGDYAKIISDNGFLIGEKNLYKWFRERRVLMKNNIPYQHFMKYFEVMEIVLTSSKRDIIRKTTRINGRGQVFFSEKIRESI